MTDFTDAIEDYRTALAVRGIDLRAAIANGAARADIIAALDDAGVVPHEGVVEWFEFCGGLTSSPSGTVMQGRGFLALGDALAQRNEAPDADYPLDYSNRMPLTSDHPVVIIELDTGAVRELDAVRGWIDLAESPTEWIRALTVALPPLGPHPHAKRIPPVSFERGELALKRLSEGPLNAQIEFFLSIEIEQLWLEIAPVNSLPGNQGLEMEQARWLRSHLLARGVSVATEIEVFEEPRRTGPAVVIAIWWLRRSGSSAASA